MGGKGLIYLQSEAIRTQSREITLGRSLREWLGRLSITAGGTSIAAVRDQAERISLCRMTFRIQSGGRTGLVNQNIVDTALFLDNHPEGQGSLFLETAPLRANEAETPTPREFRLEGAEGSPRTCPWFTHRLTQPAVPAQTKAEGRRLCRHRWLRRPNWRTVPAAGPSRRRISFAFLPRPTVRPRPVASLPSSAARVSTPPTSPIGAEPGMQGSSAA